MRKTSLSVLVALACISSTALAAYPSDELAAVNGKIADFDRLSPKPAHPRYLMGSLGASVIKAAKEDPVRLDAIARIVNKLTNKPSLTQTQVEQLSQPMTGDFWKIVGPYVEETAEAAFIYHARNKDQAMAAEVTRRLRQLAPRVGDRCTVDGDSNANNLYYTREYMINFALAYDFAFDALSDADKGLIADVLTKCAKSQLPKLAETARNTTTGGLHFNALAKYSAAMLLVRGDRHFAELDGLNYTANAVWSYVKKLPNFGGDDGGYSNGSAYFLWDTAESVASWDIISRVLDYPLYEKPYVQNLPHFLLWTLPPKSPAGAFGDGAEVNRYAVEEAERLGTSVMNRYSTIPASAAVSRWFVSNTGNGDIGRLNLLLSPAEGTATAAEPVLRSKAFTSVGLAAMHSSFADPQRTSIFFRSSPKGAVNHAHMDQNSFVIYHKGQVLAMDSGAYVNYDDAHWKNWYKKTVAHNAITYNGTGQEATGGVYGSLTSTGEIKSFNPGATAADGTLSTAGGVKYDVVTGDATKAYGQNLTKAVRTLVYVRPTGTKPSTVIVIDQLKSATPRNWEYNFHTPVIANPLSTAATKIEQKFNYSGTSMCLKVHAPTTLTQSQVNGYGAYPPALNPIPPHFWNKFAYQTAAPNGNIVSIIRLDCTAALTSDVVTFSTAGINVKIDGFEANMTDAGVFTAK